MDAVQAQVQTLRSSTNFPPSSITTCSHAPPIQIAKIAYLPPQNRAEYKGDNLPTTALNDLASSHSAIFFVKTSDLLDHNSAVESKHTFIPLVDDTGVSQTGQQLAAHLSPRHMPRRCHLLPAIAVPPCTHHPFIQCAPKSSAITVALALVSCEMQFRPSCIFLLPLASFGPHMGVP